MNLSRLRGGQLIAAIGGIVLLIALLFLNWYSVASVSLDTPFGEFSAQGDLGAWDAEGFLGVLANLVILAAGIVAVGLAVLTASSRTVALPVATSALTAALGIGAVVMVLGRMLFQPGPNGLVDLEFGIFLALVGALAVAYGGWQSMQEEGTTFEHAREQLQGRFDEGVGAGGVPPRTSRTDPGTGPGPGGTFPDAGEGPGGPPSTTPPSPGEEDTGE
jgi:hypothetical protein